MNREKKQWINKMNDLLGKVPIERGSSYCYCWGGGEYRI